MLEVLVLIFDGGNFTSINDGQTIRMFDHPNPDGHILGILIIQQNIDFGQFAYTIFPPEISLHRYRSRAQRVDLHVMAF